MVPKKIMMQKNKGSPCGCRFQEVFPMKMLNKKFVRTLSCAAVAVCAAAMLSVGAFAA